MIIPKVSAMKSITIHGLDTDLESLIRDLAKKEGLSLNKTIKKLLRKALGVSEQGKDHREDFVEFLGQWSKEDRIQFEKQIEDVKKVDVGEWQ